MRLGSVHLMASMLAVATAASSADARAADSHSEREILLDRAVARFVDPEASDAVGSIRFIDLRELVVQSWVEAWTRTGGKSSTSVEERDVKSALDVLVIESILGARPLPPSAASRLPAAITEGHNNLALSLGGEDALRTIAVRATGRPDGIDVELARIVQRRARTELYLEAVVAEPLGLSEADLRAAQPKTPPALANKPYDAVAVQLRSYVRALRLRDAAERYYQAVRGRVRLEMIDG